MPRGYPKKRGAEEEPSSTPKRQKRGGIHTLKEEHRTGTHWDTESYKVLKEAVIARSLYQKDMPKWMMIRELAEDDKQERAERKKAEKAIKKKRKEVEERKKKRERQKRKWAEQKARRAAEKAARTAEKGEDVNIEGEISDEEALDDLYYDGILGIEQFGQAAEDDWTSSSSSETPTATTISPTFPHQKLRIFEWPFDDLPDIRPPLSPYTPGGTRKDDVHDETLPLPIPYAVTQLLTSVSNEIVELPGRTYPTNIRPDFVPKLSQETMEAARNGTMIGTLRKAVVESGRAWSARTRVQGWNGRMYLRLPDREFLQANASDGPPSNVTNPVNGVTTKPSKRDKVLAFWEHSESRPPLCYLPGYLDYPYYVDMEEGSPKHWTLKNLFYVRFPGMDLPHYYFWIRPGEWRNPTKPNPQWREVKHRDEEDEQQENEYREWLFEQDRRRMHIKPDDPEGDPRPYPLDKTKTRVKKAAVPRKFQLDKEPPKTSKFKTALWSFEKELYQTGLEATLFRLRVEWLDDGKEAHWQHLTNKLLRLYPSGQLPSVPPVHLESHSGNRPKSLAEKFASIQEPAPSRPVSPMQGDEPWTRNDDAYWDVIDVSDEDVDDFAIEQERVRALEPKLHPAKLPFAENEPEFLPRTFEEFDAWLKDLDLSTAPLASEFTWSPVEETIRLFEREQWEEQFLKHAKANSNVRDVYRAGRRASSSVVPSLIARIEDMPVSELKHQLYKLMNGRLKEEHFCRVCLQPLERGNRKLIREHYAKHRDWADRVCPFCGMEWYYLDSQVTYFTHMEWKPLTDLSQWKASHIHGHDFDAGPGEGYRRGSSSIATSRRSSLKSSQTGSRRSSKVTFSPKTVEKRIAYNDDPRSTVEGEAGGDANLAHFTKRSSLKPGLKRDFSDLRVNTDIPYKARRLAAPSSKGKKRRHSQLEDPSYSEPSTPSSHVPSPYLPHIHRYPPDHPNAAWDPRRWSKSTEESLEFLRERSGNSGKKRQKYDPNYVPSPPSSPSPTVRAAGRKRTLNDPTYRYQPSLSSQSTLSAYDEPKIPKRPKVGDSTYHYRPSPASTPSTPTKPRKRVTKKKGLRSPSSTISNASSDSIQNRVPPSNESDPELTILGNPYVEPLVVAPARTWGKRPTGATISPSRTPDQPITAATPEASMKPRAHRSPAQRFESASPIRPAMPSQPTVGSRPKAPGEPRARRPLEVEPTSSSDQPFFDARDEIPEGLDTGVIRTRKYPHSPPFPKPPKTSPKKRLRSPSTRKGSDASVVFPNATPPFPNTPKASPKKRIRSPSTPRTPEQAVPTSVTSPPPAPKKPRTGRASKASSTTVVPFPRLEKEPRKGHPGRSSTRKTPEPLAIASTTTPPPAPRKPRAPSKEFDADPVPFPKLRKEPTKRPPRRPSTPKTPEQPIITFPTTPPPAPRKTRAKSTNEFTAEAVPFPKQLLESTKKRPGRPTTPKTPERRLPSAPTTPPPAPKRKRAQPTSTKSTTTAVPFPQLQKESPKKRGRRSAIAQTTSPQIIPTSTSALPLPKKPKLKPHRPLSFDSGLSLGAPLVPPNTPATILVTSRRTSVAVPVEEMVGEEGVVSTGLDAGVLSSKIGDVKTTRRGVSREVAATVKTGLAGKRGTAVGKNGRVVGKKGGAVEKKGGAEDLGGRRVTRSMAKAEVEERKGAGRGRPKKSTKTKP